MVQFPLLEALDDESPRLRHLCVFVGATAAVSGTVAQDAPGSSIAATASTNDEAVVVVVEDESTRAPRLAAATAAACGLRKLFDCGYCDAVDDEPMLEIDRRRAVGSRC